MKRGIQAGDTVRMYGYPGTFVVRPFCRARGSRLRSDVWVTRAGDPEDQGFPASSASVVELNGRPLPLLSCPIAPPADDYPHEPTFDYSDGPQENGRGALRHWREARRVAAGVCCSCGRPKCICEM